MIEPIVVPFIWLILFPLLLSTMPINKKTEHTISEPEAYES